MHCTLIFNSLHAQLKRVGIGKKYEWTEWPSLRNVSDHWFVLVCLTELLENQNATIAAWSVNPEPPRSCQRLNIAPNVQCLLLNRFWCTIRMAAGSQGLWLADILSPNHASQSGFSKVSLVTYEWISHLVCRHRVHDNIVILLTYKWMCMYLIYFSDNWIYNAHHMCIWQCYVTYFERK